MRIMVVGYGSMGRRRIRLIRRLIQDCEFICVDSNLERRNSAQKDNVKAFETLEDALKEKPQVAFVCTSPASHGDIIRRLVDEKVNVFTELNLISKGYDYIINKAEENDVKLFMSSTSLYNRVIKRIIAEIKKQDKHLTYIYHVGQYLPDWHPWESYKDFFVGKKETNGCREIFAIQLPWIIEAFGKVETLCAFGQKATELEIDYKDSIVASFKHLSGSQGTFVADVTSRQATTYFEVIGEDVHIKWDGTNTGLYIYDPESGTMKNISVYDNCEHIDGYSEIIDENEYLDELKAFFDYIKNGVYPVYDFKDDSYTLSIIDEIERQI